MIFLSFYYYMFRIVLVLNDRLFYLCLKVFVIEINEINGVWNFFKMY